MSQFDRSRSQSDEKIEALTTVDDIEKFGVAHAAIDPAAERKLLRKYDLFILPIMTLIFLLNFIDRSAVGNANVAGLSKDLNLSAARFDYNVALMIFYIFYIIIEVPSNLILKKVGSVWLSILTVGFGVVTLCTAFIHTYHQFIGIRILLGIFEGGTLPGIAYTMSLFYKRSELVFRIGFFLALGPSLSGAFGGLLAGALVKDTTIGSVVSWRKIFLVEGLITASIGLISVFLIPTSPQKSRWLTPEEKELARLRFESENVTENGKQDRTEWRLVRRAFGNILTWICIAGYSFINIIVQGTSLFLPTIIRALNPKLSTVQVQLRSVPPYVLACFWSIFVSYMCWKQRKHGAWIAGSLVPSIIGYVIFLATKNATARYVAAFFTYTGAVPCGPIFLAWATSNMAPTSSRAVTAALVPSFGTMGSIVATWAYLPKTAPNFVPGNALNVAACTMAALLALSGVFYIRWENKQREMGRRDHRLEGISQHELDTLGSKHPSFRLIE